VVVWWSWRPDGGGGVPRRLWRMAATSAPEGYGGGMGGFGGGNIMGVLGAVAAVAAAR